MVSAVALSILCALIRSGSIFAESMPHHLLVSEDGFATIEFRIVAAPTKAVLTGLRPMKLPVFQKRADGSVQRGMVVKRVEGQRTRQPYFVDRSSLDGDFRVHYSWAALSVDRVEPRDHAEQPAVSIRTYFVNESDGVPIFYLPQNSE